MKIKKADIKGIPKRNTLDVLHTATKIGLSAIPFFGGPAAEFFAAVITPSVVKRRDKWIEALHQDILLLKEKFNSFNPIDLENNEPFITAVLHASQAASRTHDNDKREALKNAVLNVALKNEPDEDLQIMFLNYIDELTRWHLRLIAFYSSPVSYYKKLHSNYPPIDIDQPHKAIESTFPELISARPFLDQVIRDIESRGLFATDNLVPLFSASGAFAKRTSDLGDRFLRFISYPESK